jgi:hypothetical protein
MLVEEEVELTIILLELEELEVEVTVGDLIRLHYQQVQQLILVEEEVVEHQVKLVEMVEKELLY